MSVATEKSMFICIRCSFCGGMTDITVPRDGKVGESFLTSPVPKSLTFPGSQAHRDWSRLAELLGMPLAELAEMGSVGHLLPLVIAKLEGRMR